MPLGAQRNEAGTGSPALWLQKNLLKGQALGNTSRVCVTNCQSPKSSVSGNPEGKDGQGQGGEVGGGCSLAPLQGHTVFLQRSWWLGRDPGLRHLLLQPVPGMGKGAA